MSVMEVATPKYVLLSNLSGVNLSFPRLPICQESESNTQTLSDVLRQGIFHHAKELKDARAVIDGNLVRQTTRYHVFTFCIICLSIYPSIYTHLLWMFVCTMDYQYSHIAAIVLSSKFSILHCKLVYLLIVHA